MDQLPIRKLLRLLTDRAPRQPVPEERAGHLQQRRRVQDMQRHRPPRERLPVQRQVRQVRRRGAHGRAVPTPVRVQKAKSRRAGRRRRRRRRAGARTQTQEEKVRRRQERRRRHGRLHAGGPRAPDGGDTRGGG